MTYFNGTNIINTTNMPINFGNLFGEILTIFTLFVAPGLIMVSILTYPIWPRMDRAWWISMVRNVAIGIAGLAAIIALELAMYFWTIPILSFIFRHEGKILVGGLVTTILGIWAYIAYEDYKLSGNTALNGHLWGAFHITSTILFIIAFINFHQQAMAHIALIWGFVSFYGLISLLDENYKRVTYNGYFPPRLR